MYLRTIRNDVLKNKAITLTTMGFVAAAAMLVSLAVILVVNLSGSIDRLMEQAKTPHFLQMHSGTIDLARLKNFAGQNDNVDQVQVLEFLNLDGARIVFEGKSLAGSVQDNGFSVQSELFDYLLDLNGEIIRVRDGEIYVPICYLQDASAKVGDRVLVAGQKFVVAGFLRDSQMNSLLSSSKRFLVSPNDYAAIRGGGRTEYLIEFRLKDLAGLGEFETAYTTAGLEANGPAVTYPLFKTMNAISDGLMIAVILLVSGLVVMIALLCIRFTLLAKIEDDYREIGVMKAIGLRVSDIQKIYLSLYAAIAGVGCGLGFGLSFVFRGLLLENIRLYMGESENEPASLGFGILGVLLVFLILLGYVNGVLRRFRKISPAEALRFGTGQEKTAGGKLFTLTKAARMNTNLFLGIKDVLSRKRMYATLLVILVLAAFIIIVPQNLSNTISSKNFITYMGVGDCDLRIDIQQTERITEKAAEIEKMMKADAALSKTVVLTTQTFVIQMADGSEENIKVELGDHSVFPVAYSAGRAPAAPDEIALSVLNAKELGKKPGDSVTLVIEGKSQPLRVSGLYSDITNGGKSAKAIFSAPSADVMWIILQARLIQPELAEQKAREYAERFDDVKVSGIDAYIGQTFGATMNSIGKASNTAMGVALLITLLVTLLFIKMLITKDRYSIAVMKVFGFTNRDIRAQYVTRSVFVLVIGVVLGAALANTLGEALTGAVIGAFGAASFRFEVNPFWAYGICPLLMCLSVLLATLWGTQGAGQIKIVENIKE